jgi:hypothetical protein
MPGFEENELNVQINNGVLTIQAEKEQQGEGREEYRSNYRSFTLPQGINPDKVQGTYRNGVPEPVVAADVPERVRVGGRGPTGGVAASYELAATSAEDLLEERSANTRRNGREMVLADRQHCWH